MNQDTQKRPFYSWVPSRENPETTARLLHTVVTLVSAQQHSINTEREKGAGSQHTVAGDALVVCVRGCPSPSIMPPCTRYVPPWWETSWPWRLPSCWLVLIWNRHITSGHSLGLTGVCMHHTSTHYATVG